MTFAKAFVGVLVAFFIVDIVWILRVVRPMYDKQIGGLLRPEPQLAAAAVFYLVYAAGVVYFAVLPALSSGGMRAALKDIGRDGVCFQSPDPFAAQDMLSLKIHLLGWQRHQTTLLSILDEATAAAPLTAVAEVIWCKASADESGYDVGARFRDIYEDDFKAFLKHLQNIF